MPSSPQRSPQISNPKRAYQSTRYACALNVIGGPASFVAVAQDMDSFADAMLRSENADARRIAVDGVGKKVGKLAAADLEKAGSDPAARVRRGGVAGAGAASIEHPAASIEHPAASIEHPEPSWLCGAARPARPALAALGVTARDGLGVAAS